MSVSPELSVELRPATDADRNFCFAIHKAAMHDVVDQIWGWDDEDQSRYFDRTWQPANTQVVLVDGVDGGVLCVDRREEEICLGRIEIDSSLQGNGIGTILVKKLQTEAQNRGVPVVLEVLENNGRAKALYSRLGFEVTEVRGHKTLMRWKHKTHEGDA